jgi:transcriptional regulator with XRE-family HTH domain
MIKKGTSSQELKEKIGKNIENFRHLQNKGTKEMAKSLGITEVAYRNIERGITDVTLIKIMQIAESLNVHYSQILEFESSLIVNYNNSGTGNTFAYENNQVDTGYKLLIDNLQENINFLRKQNRELMATLKGKK